MFGLHFVSSWERCKAQKDGKQERARLGLRRSSLTELSLLHYNTPKRKDVTTTFGFMVIHP
jgi:hypothetical protein